MDLAFLAEYSTTVIALCGILIGLCSFLLGLFAFPLIIFLRARRDAAWDDSNMSNIYRVIGHIGAHPSDFSKMRYIGSGKNPFWYISKDEYGEVVKSRPEDE